MLMMRRWTEGQKNSIRHWAMEFIVVVSGVLLALWLQEWLERQRARSDMRAAEAAIHDEVRSSLEAIMWRKAISKCHIDRQNLLLTMLAKSGENWPGLKENAIAMRSAGPPTVISSVYSRPLENFSAAAWNSALTTGALAPMDAKRFADLVSIYAHIDHLRRTAADETDAASDLAPLSLPMRLTPELRAQMIKAVYRTDRARFTFGMVSPTDFAQGMRELGWNDEQELDQFIREDAAEAKASGFVFRDCVAKVENPFSGATN